MEAAGINVGRFRYKVFREKYASTPGSTVGSFFVDRVREEKSIFGNLTLYRDVNRQSVVRSTDNIDCTAIGRYFHRSCSNSIVKQVCGILNTEKVSKGFV